ncbi:cytochrome P450 [Mycena rosella]|uniref:Cytochrome P450 n=1 Tax=Mycena rosella TaxID=1033263 RepID=A0AAD7G4S7_MYCRO|nr:cytochrome P450 [Mycena rosella]
MTYSAITAGFVAIFALYVLFLRRRAVGNLVGLPSPSWVFGNMLQLMLPPLYGDHEFKWQKLYGPVYRLKGCFGQDRLMVSDPAALQYILNSPQFEHEPMLDNKVHLMFGEGSVSAAKGTTHRHLRAALNSFFTATATRNYQPLIEQIAQKMTEELSLFESESTDICPLFRTATLGVVSETIFGYATEDLGEEFVANNSQVMGLASIQSAGHIMADAIGAYLPTWLLNVAIHLPTDCFKVICRAKYLSNQLGRQIVRERAHTVRHGLELTDMFGLFVNAQESEAKKNTISEKELAAQTAIILIAGQDTTANTLVFGLLELARDSEFQQKLRAEVRAARSTRCPMTYDTLPLLNAFIKVCVFYVEKIQII